MSRGDLRALAEMAAGEPDARLRETLIRALEANVLRARRAAEARRASC